MKNAFRILLFLAINGSSLTLFAAGDSILLRLQQQVDDTNKMKQLLTYGEQHEDGQLDLCRTLYLQVIEIAKRNSHDYYVSKGYNYLGILCRKEAKYQEAIHYFHESELAAKRCQNTFRIAAAETNMANVLLYLGRYAEASKKLHESIRIYDQLNLKKPLAQAYGNLSIIYNLQKEFTGAVRLAQQGIEIAQSIQDPDLLCDLQLNKATPLERTGKYHEAEVLVTACIDHYRTKPISEKLVHAYQLAGSIFCDTKQYPLAIPYTDSALALANKLHLPRQVFLANLQRANIASEQEDFHYANQLLSNASKLPILKNDWELRSNLASSYERLEKAQGKLKEALSFAYEKQRLQDSMQNKFVLQENLELDKKYASLQRRQQIENLQKEKKLQELTIRQKNILLWSGSIGFISLLLVLGLLYLSIKRKRQHDQQLILQLQQEKKLEAATRIVQIQDEERKRIARDLHDGLGSMLSGIRLSLLSEVQKDPHHHAKTIEQTAIHLEGAIQEMRRISQNMMPDSLQQLGLQEALRNLCNSLQQSSGITVLYQCFALDQRLPIAQEMMVYRLVQELLQNAIKHSRATQLIVELSTHERIMHITVEDNGQGFDPSQPVQGSGLKNVQYRVNFLNGSLEIESKEQQGTSIYIQFPMQDEHN